MIDHEDIYCSLSINDTLLQDCELKSLKITTALDRPFVVKISLLSHKALRFFQQNVFNPFTLKISGQDFPACYFHGVLTQVRFRGHHRYELCIEPAVALYRDETYQHLFNGVSVIDIAKQILWGRSFNITAPMFQDYAIKLMGDRDYPLLYRILMRDETVLQFFQRILSYQGLAYYFDYSLEKSPLIITDFINHFANQVDAVYSQNSPHALTLKPYIETIISKSTALPASVLSSGAPTLQPNTLVAEMAEVLKTSPANTLYHVNTNEQSDTNAKTRADIARLALLSQKNTAEMLGGGLLFAGMKVNLNGAWLIRTSTIDIAFDEHNAERLGSIATILSVQDAAVRYQAMPQFGEHASIITGIKTGTSGTEMGVNWIIFLGGFWDGAWADCYSWRSCCSIRWLAPGNY